MTKAFLFDLGNVIVGFDFARGYRAIQNHSPFQADEIPSRIGASGLVAPYERGEISSPDFFRQVSEALRMTISYEEFCSIWSTIFLPEPILPEELLVSLRERYRLVLISNTNDIHFRMIDANYPLLRHFDARVLSYQVGAIKPEEKMYAEAVREAGFAPAECLYIDDVLEFVEGGRRFGLDAMAFTGRSDLERELKMRNLL